MAPIHVLRVDPIQLAHTPPKIPVDRFKQQVIVVGHLAISVNDPIEALAHLSQNGQVVGAVLIAQEDILPTISPRRDVIKRTRYSNLNGLAMKVV